MPSVAHQALVELFREHPALVLQLLQAVPELGLRCTSTPGRSRWVPLADESEGDRTAQVPCSR